MNLNEIKNLSSKILSESTQGQENYLNRWPYTSPYLEEKKCDFGKAPCVECGIVHQKDKVQKEELHPSLKKFDAINKKRVEKQSQDAAAQRANRQAEHDAFRAHKNEVMSKGGRPVDALDSWMRKKLGLEHIDTVSKLIESNKFSEEEIISIIETIG